MEHELVLIVYLKKVYVVRLNVMLPPPPPLCWAPRDFSRLLLRIALLLEIAYISVLQQINMWMLRKNLKHAPEEINHLQ